MNMSKTPKTPVALEGLEMKNERIATIVGKNNDWEAAYPESENESEYIRIVESVIEINSNAINNNTLKKMYLFIIKGLCRFPESLVLRQFKSDFDEHHTNKFNCNGCSAKNIECGGDGNIQVTLIILWHLLFLIY